jgi:quinol-cytochrome oxidoreductase complex cytochrome b subunit
MRLHCQARWKSFRDELLVEVLPAGVGGTVLLLSLLVFLGVPLLDRTPDKPARRRPVALLLFAGTCMGLLLLSYIGYTLRG